MAFCFNPLILSFFILVVLLAVIIIFCFLAKIEQAGCERLLFLPRVAE
jgi:hypothetical protein